MTDEELVKELMRAELAKANYTLNAWQTYAAGLTGDAAVEAAAVETRLQAWIADITERIGT